MITVSKQENGVLFTFTNSDKYLYGSGTIEVPFNSLSIIQDESDNITLRKSASNDIFLSARYDTDFGYASKEEAVNALKEILYDEAGLSEEEVQEMIDAATSGIPSSEVVEQLRRDVNAVSGEVDTKQDILTAGENITISGNVISADAGNNIIELTQAEYDALETKDPEALYIITDAQEINMNDYYTKSEVTTALAGKLDASAYTPTDLSEYWTSGQTQEAINAATSGIPSSQVIEALRNDVNELSGAVDTHEADIADIWDTIDEKEEVIASALTQLNQDVSAIDAKEEVIASALTEVNQALNNKLDASAYTPTDLSEYWTSGQTQNAINAATSGIPSSQVVEQLRTDLNTVSGDVADKQDALEYYSEDTENKSAEILITNGEGSTEEHHFSIGGGVAEIGIYSKYDDGQGNVTSNNAIIYADQTMVTLQAGITENGDTTSTEFSVDATGVTINGDAVATEPYVDAATSGKADTSAVTAVNGALTAHTADTTVHVSQAEKDAWNAKVDASAITSIESAVTTLSGAVIDNEYTVSQAINELKSTKLDASAYTPTDLSQYWTSAQTQTAINAKQDALTAGSGISISNNVISTSGVVMSQQVTQIVKLTQAAYDALTTKDNQTLYIVVD